MASKRQYKIVARLGGGMIAIRCPRRECKGVFHVDAKRWAESWHGTGRACPYCFVPSSLPPKKDQKVVRLES